MPRAGHTIEDDPGDPHARPPVGKACDQRRNGLAVPVGIDDEDDGKAECLGKVAGGALPVCRRVKQPHHPFYDQEISAGGMLCGQRLELVGRHGPGIEIDCLATGGPSQKNRVDIVRTGLGGRQDQATSAQRGQQAKRDQRLAGPRSRGGDHKALSQRHVSVLRRHTSRAGPDTVPRGRARRWPVSVRRAGLLRYPAWFRARFGSDRRYATRWSAHRQAVVPPPGVCLQ
ncbi:hypothetical protein D3C87_1472010 [compost metagenome]